MGSMAQADGGGGVDAGPATVEGLPAEVLLEVFSYLAPADLARAAGACERWRVLLARHTSVWRHKEYFSRRKAARDEVAAIARAMPRLRCVHVLRDREFGVHVAWPEAAVSLSCDPTPQPPQVPPVRLPRRAPPPPYTVEFDTRRLVVCGATFQQCLRWAKCETLEAVRVADQCEGAGTHMASPFYYYRDCRRAAHCFGPVCSFHSPQPAFCALCAYSHHFNCAGAACPLAGPQDGVELWCHPDPDAPSGRPGVVRERREVAVADDDDEEGLGPSLEAELEAAARRPLAVRLPALEEVSVSGAGLAPADLRLLCAAGRPRTLHLDSPCLRLCGLAFLRLCRDSLEELTLADASWLPPEAFRELRHLRALRLLRVSRFHPPHSEIARFARHLPGLQCVFRKPLEVIVVAEVRADGEEEEEDIELDE